MNSLFNVAPSHRKCNELKSDKPAWEWFGLMEGLLYKENGNSALLLTFDSEEELFSVINKLIHTRNKKLKSMMQNLMRRLDWV